MGRWEDGGRIDKVSPCLLVSLSPCPPAKVCLAVDRLSGAAYVAGICVSITCRKLAIAASATQTGDKRILFNLFSTSTHQMSLSFVLCRLSFVENQDE